MFMICKKSLSSHIILVSSHNSHDILAVTWLPATEGREEETLSQWMLSILTRNSRDKSFGNLYGNSYKDTTNVQERNG
jgi:hypothetical protein